MRGALKVSLWLKNVPAEWVCVRVTFRLQSCIRQLHLSCSYPLSMPEPTLGNAGFVSSQVTLAVVMCGMTSAASGARAGCH